MLEIRLICDTGDETRAVSALRETFNVADVRTYPARCHDTVRLYLTARLKPTEDEPRRERCTSP